MLTNNDTEGWHHALNRGAEGKTRLPLYLLIQLLHQEARLTSLQIRLVTEKKLKKVQRKTYRMIQSKRKEKRERTKERKRKVREMAFTKACLNLVGISQNKSLSKNSGLSTE